MIQFDIAPWLPVIGVVVGASIAGLVTIVRGRMGDRASKAPTVEQVWARLDSVEMQISAERVARRTLRNVFLSYVHRVQSGGSSELTYDEREALDAEPNLEAANKKD